MADGNLTIGKWRELRAEALHGIHQNQLRISMMPSSAPVQEGVLHVGANDCSCRAVTSVLEGMGMEPNPSLNL